MHLSTAAQNRNASKLGRHYQFAPTECHCPVCHADRGQLLYTVDAEQATQHYVLAEADPARHAALERHIQQLWQQEYCDVVRCTECGFCFARPFVAGDSRFYDLAYQRTGYPARKWEYDRTLQTLTHLIGAGLLNAFALLEIGAGDGAFVKRVAPALTTKDRVLCTEYSEYGREAIQAYGIECRSEDVRALPLEHYRGRFDVVCMFQIMEHMDGVDEIFEQIAALTRDHAHLFIAVPNEKRIAFNERHGSLLDLPPNHLGRWNRRCFQILAQRHGWREIDYQIEPERATQKLRQYVIYRYLHMSQTRNSLANRIERLRGAARRPLQAAAAAFYAALALPQIIALLTADELGDSQWVHLQRNV